MKTFIIEYELGTSYGNNLNQKIKVKNCMSDIHAKIKLEAYLRKKNPSFKYLVVNKCYEENSFFSIYSDIFKV